MQRSAEWVWWMKVKWRGGERENGTNSLYMTFSLFSKEWQEEIGVISFLKGLTENFPLLPWILSCVWFWNTVNSNGKTHGITRKTMWCENHRVMYHHTLHMWSHDSLYFFAWQYCIETSTDGMGERTMSWDSNSACRKCTYFNKNVLFVMGFFFALFCLFCYAFWQTLYTLYFKKLSYDTSL